ncbi:MAG: hypothetical protein ABJL67_02560 [Sulfitobacter sp.]
MLVDFGDVAFQLREDRSGACAALIPSVGEHGLGKRQKALRGLHIVQQRHEFTFQHIPADRLAVARAAFLEAHIVWVLLACFAFGPVGGQWIAAFVTAHEAAQGEIFVDICSRRRARCSVQTILNGIPRFKADQPLVLAFAQARHHCVAYLCALVYGAALPFCWLLH